jgi:hypothetical protein
MGKASMIKFGNIDHLKRNRKIEGETGTAVGLPGGITLTVLCASDANPAWKRFGDQFVAELRRMSAANASEDDVKKYVAERLTTLLITGWDGVTDVDGNPVPFSRDACIQFLMQTDDVVAAVQRIAFDSQYFRGQRIEAVIGEAKN